MKLGEFITKYIEPNSLIRLLYKNENGHEIILNSWDDVSMEWEIIKGQGKFRHYVNNNVIGITDILVQGPYCEAINIVIEKLDNQPVVEDTFSKNEQYTESVID